ncbi:hypothetical protein AN639_10025 [Candidatus Epulonipiscium fishelsonii]|uniref:Uncharacterized protein n=1 Tax=Candidatus Epulonipiscium fishelsonii TaxID=77094 RepID=A0ACC8X9N3_9FIRM|nr:hypothetical protein AN396_09575 [Epulopiscium sp. SCG-B11WGA-EpuloA1]ONI43774.1 hypothetical protein AN639_10025 [Epulopiscium sp. SCG-B05WGA-EpuloA1]
MYMINKFLLSREERVNYQISLLNKYPAKTLVTVKINYPGLNKSNFVNDQIIEIICDQILLYYSTEILHYEYYNSLEGVIYHFIFDIDFENTKKVMVAIEENHILGRCVDIDVYKLEETIVSASRTHLGFPARKCFICEEDARICSRKQTHPFEVIENYFSELYMKYVDTRADTEKKCNQIALLVCKAIICEASTYPSFGLVSPVSNGAHDDMDYYMFLNSALAITPYFKQMAIAGFTFIEPERIFNVIRNIGIECEHKMYEVTKGVNTHKGLIFLMGVCITSLTKNMYDDGNFENIQNIIKLMVTNILDDFKNVNDKEKLTHGERLYVKNGFTGIRGQVKDGLDIIFSHIIKLYEHNDLPERERNVQILIELMAQVEDSTVVYRHNLPTLRQVQQDAKKLLKMGGISTHNGREFMDKLQEHYIENKISSGGCADLLAISIFLLEIKSKFY